MNIEEYLSWFFNQNVNTENVHLSYHCDTGFGLYTSRTFPDTDNLILSIPEQLFIKPQPNHHDLTGFEQLIEYLLTRTDHPYVKFLLSINAIPIWRKYSHENFPTQIRKKLNQHLEKYHQSKLKFLQYDDEQFELVYYSINTRSFFFNMNIQSKHPDDNLCLIPFLDFINHSIEPNTISTFNISTRSYELRNIKPIETINEQITFLYNQHSNIELFIEYGFLLPNNIYNQLDISKQLRTLLTDDHLLLLDSYRYWNNLEFFTGVYDIPWTILKIFELIIKPECWSPIDDPSRTLEEPIKRRLRQFLLAVAKTIDDDFTDWQTESLHYEKNIFYLDFQRVLNDTTKIVDELTLTT